MRLIFQKQFPPRECLAQMDFQAQTLLDHQILRGRKEPEGILAHGFGVVHGHVCPGHQGFRGVAVLRKHADAHADRHTGLMIERRQANRFPDGLHDLFCHRGHILHRFHLGQQDDELVPPQARHRIPFAQCIGQNACHGFQQGVPRRMAIGVVDPLEIIQIDEHQGHFTVMALTVGQHLTQAVLDQPPIGQPGQRIEVGQIIEVLLGLLHLAHFPGIFQNQGEGVGKTFGQQFILFGKLLPFPLFTEVNPPIDPAPVGNRDRQQGMHDRMSRRKPRAARIPGQFREPEHRILANDDAQQAPPFRKSADPGHLLLGHSGVMKIEQCALLVQNADGAVTGLKQLSQGLDPVLQEVGFERSMGKHLEQGTGGFVQICQTEGPGGQLFLVVRDLPVEAMGFPQQAGFLLQQGAQDAGTGHQADECLIPVQYRQGIHPPPPHFPQGAVHRILGRQGVNGAMLDQIRKNPAGMSRNVRQ